VRRRVAEVTSLTVDYTEPDAIPARYAELLAMRAHRQSKLSEPLRGVTREDEESERSGNILPRVITYNVI